MKFIYGVFILLFVLIPSAQCQETAGDWLIMAPLLPNKANIMKPSYASMSL